MNTVAAVNTLNGFDQYNEIVADACKKAAEALNAEALRELALHSIPLIQELPMLIQEPPMYSFGSVMMEERCPVCEGTKKVMSTSHTVGRGTTFMEVWCDKCNGVGRIMTTEGKAFFGFLTRHVKVHVHGVNLISKSGASSI